MLPTNFSTGDTVYEGEYSDKNVPIRAFNYTLTSTTRGSKVKTLTETINRPGLEFAQIDDVATSDLTETLKGNILTNS